MTGVRRESVPPGPPYGGLRLGLRAGPALWVLRRIPTPRRTPFTLAFLVTLGTTTVFSRLADPELVRHLQELSSTDGHNLLRHPLRALLLSGFWVAGPVWMPYLWAFAFTVAPLERRVGPARAAGVFGAGHVLATLLSQGVVAAAVRTGRLGPDALDTLDIGVSYGVLASLGALAALLPRPGRLLVLAGAGLLVADQVVTDQDLVTGVGHPAALLLGVLFGYRLRRRPRPPRRVRGPRPAGERSRAEASRGRAVLDRA
ncbi:rhomboid-like protein [Kitasatospora indigofera]|uniref:rhomboid-like protein n=2 Tax=Kitasatospora indigofera TaxID=67307 RepID=UPI0036791A22